MTDKIKLRTLLITDKTMVLELLMTPEVMVFLGPRRSLSETEALQWFETELVSPSRFVISLIHSDELIGFCGVKEIDATMDFGYFIRRKYWGNGYAKKACELAIHKLSEDHDVTTFQVFIAAENKASLAIAEKLNWLKLNDVIKHNEHGAYYKITTSHTC